MGRFVFSPRIPELVASFAAFRKSLAGDASAWTDAMNTRDIALEDWLAHLAAIGPFSAPGPVVAIASGRYYPEAAIRINTVLMSLKTAGSTTTTAVLQKNGATVATLSLAASATYVALPVNINFLKTDYASLEITAAGTGAYDLTVQTRSL